jgi:hypothetical protein
MTLDEAIKHAEEVADKKEREKKKWERWLKNDSDYRAVAEKVSCELCAEEHRQIAEWLKELKQLREQTGWIPVSERMPNFNDIVLASTDSDYDELKVVLTVYGAEEFWFNGKIKAWIPLPEPYKA